MEQDQLSPTIEQQLCSEGLVEALAPAPTMEGLPQHEVQYLREALTNLRKAQAVLDFVVAQIQSAHQLEPHDRIHEEGYILRMAPPLE